MHQRERARIRTARMRLLAAPAALLAASMGAQAATHTVTQNGDAGIGSLRWAVEQANAAPAGEAQEIRFQLAEAFRQINLTGRLVISHPNVSIQGLATDSLDSAGRIRIANPGAAGSGVFELLAAVTRFALRDVDLGPAVRTTYRRGGCLDAETVSPTLSQITIERVVFSGCVAQTSSSLAPEGGAVYANGSLLVRDSLFVDNRVEWLAGSNASLDRAFGGALAMERGLLTVLDTTFESNIAAALPFGSAPRAAGGAVAYTQANGFGMSFERVLFVDNRAQDVECGSSGDGVCDVQGFGGALFSRAASTVLRRSVFARNAAVEGAAIVQIGDAGFEGRLDLDNVVFNGGAAFRGTVWLGGEARLRQRNVTYHDIDFDDRSATSPSSKIPVLYMTGGRVDASHSVLIGRINRTAFTQNTPLCLGFGPAAPIQGNSLAVEPADPNTGTHSCAFLGTTRVALADVGIPETGRWDFEPRGLALENGAAGAPSALDWSRCSPFDAFGRARNIDADGDDTARCDVGAIEGLAPSPELFADGFEP
mgnify:CR=1 FL=1